LFIITRACRHEDRETAHLIPKIEGPELQLGNPGFEILRVRDLVHEKDKMGSEENLQFGVPEWQVQKSACRDGWGKRCRASIEKPKAIFCKLQRQIRNK